jgi:hypothetical protein
VGGFSLTEELAVEFDAVVIYLSLGDGILVGILLEVPAT